MLPETPYTFTGFGDWYIIWNEYASSLSRPAQARESTRPGLLPISIPTLMLCLTHTNTRKCTDNAYSYSTANAPFSAPLRAQPVSDGVSDMPSRTATQLNTVNTPVAPQPPTSQVRIDLQPAPVRQQLLIRLLHKNRINHTSQPHQPLVIRISLGITIRIRSQNSRRWQLILNRRLHDNRMILTIQLQ